MTADFQKKPITVERVKEICRPEGLTFGETDQPNQLFTVPNGVPIRVDLTQADAVLKVSSQLPDHPVPADRTEEVLAWMTYTNEAIDFVQCSTADYGEPFGVVLSIDLPIMVPGGVTDEQLRDYLFMSVGTLLAVAENYQKSFFGDNQPEQAN